ncbi:MAG: thermonuclease family protein [Sphingosinicella sp.]|nr:thermonuclease family protein [Sphingosinicella sp.]
MSKPWNPRFVQARPYRPRRRRSRLSWGEIRLTLLGGVAIGLVYFSYGGGELALPGTHGEVGVTSGGARVEDPWAASITDGDTFRYHGQKIRIADIDTPEVDGRCEYESTLAAKATDRMETLLHAGPFEMLPNSGRDEDVYGRKLRIVTRGGQSLGDQLVAEGLARTWSGRREPWC